MSLSVFLSDEGDEGEEKEIRAGYESGRKENKQGRGGCYMQGSKRISKMREGVTRRKRSNGTVDTVRLVGNVERSRGGGLGGRAVARAVVSVGYTLWCGVGSRASRHEY